MQVALVRKFGFVRFSAEWKLEGNQIWGGCVNVYMVERSQFLLCTCQTPTGSPTKTCPLLILDSLCVKDRKYNKDLSSAHLGFSFRKGQEVQQRPVLCSSWILFALRTGSTTKTCPLLILDSLCVKDRKYNKDLSSAHLEFLLRKGKYVQRRPVLCTS